MAFNHLPALKPQQSHTLLLITETDRTASDLPNNTPTQNIIHSSFIMVKPCQGDACKFLKASSASTLCQSGRTRLPSQLNGATRI